jgi:hypothetical protein
MLVCLRGTRRTDFHQRRLLVEVIRNKPGKKAE